jgi:hypothetical protein
MLSIVRLISYDSNQSTYPLKAFQVFFSNQGGQGLLGKPSKQQLETIFGTAVDVDVIKYMLKNGKEQAGDALSSGPASTNSGRGIPIDNKSRISSGVGSKH